MIDDLPSIDAPALVIVGWGTSGAQLLIEGKEVAQGPDFRVGHRHGLEDSDLIVWIKHEATAPFEMTLTRGVRNQ